MEESSRCHHGSRQTQTNLTLRGRGGIPHAEVPQANQRAALKRPPLYRPMKKWVLQDPYRMDQSKRHLGEPDSFARVSPQL